MRGEEDHCQSADCVNEHMMSPRDACKGCSLGLLQGTEAHVMTPNGIELFSLSRGAMLVLTCFFEMALDLQMNTVRAYTHIRMATGNRMAAMISTV